MKLVRLLWSFAFFEWAIVLMARFCTSNRTLTGNDFFPFCFATDTNCSVQDFRLSAANFFLRTYWTIITIFLLNRIPLKRHSLLCQPSVCLETRIVHPGSHIFMVVQLDVIAPFSRNRRPSFSAFQKHGWNHRSCLSFCHAISSSLLTDSHRAYSYQRENCTKLSFSARTVWLIHSVSSKAQITEWGLHSLIVSARSTYPQSRT